MTRAYPDVKELECAVLSIGGYLNTRCTVSGGKLEPALAPVTLSADEPEGVLKNSRIFTVDGDYKICWTGPDGAEDTAEGISGAGWVYVNKCSGKIQRLVVFNGSITILCEYGLAVLTAYGAPENFKLTYIDGKLPHIWGSTAAVVCNKLIFFTDDGLYAFDGGKVEKSDLGSLYALSNPVSACALGEWYYIQGYCESLRKTAVLCVNITDGSVYFADIAGSTEFLGEQVYSCAYEFVSGNIDFGTQKRKVLERLELISDGKVDIEVSNGFKTRILRGVNGNIRVNLSGKSFKITIRGTAGIYSLRAFAEVVNGI